MSRKSNCASFRGSITSKPSESLYEFTDWSYACDDPILERGKPSLIHVILDPPGAVSLYPLMVEYDNHYPISVNILDNYTFEVTATVARKEYHISVGYNGKFRELFFDVGRTKLLSYEPFF